MYQIQWRTHLSSLFSFKCCECVGLCIILLEVALKLSQFRKMAHRLKEVGPCCHISLQNHGWYMYLKAARWRYNAKVFCLQCCYIEIDQYLQILKSGLSNAQSSFTMIDCLTTGFQLLHRFLVILLDRSFCRIISSPIQLWLSCVASMDPQKNIKSFGSSAL